MLHFPIVTNTIRVNSTAMLDTVDAPLTPRSIVLSVLLGTHPPQMPVGRILQFTSLFAIPDGTVRTAMSRMVAAGELENADGVYRLSGRLLERQAQQDAGRTDPPRTWDGTWWVAAVLVERRSVGERRAFRSRVDGARLGELRPDLWLRPANIVVPHDLPDVILTRGPLTTGDPESITRRLWDLDGLDLDARRHLRAIDDTAADLATGDQRSLAGAFVTLAACQRFLRTEPQLPVELFPSGASTDLRAGYGRAVTGFQRLLAEFFSTRTGA